MASNTEVDIPRMDISYRFFISMLRDINNVGFREVSFDALNKVQKVDETQARFIALYPEITAIVPPAERQLGQRCPSEDEINAVLHDIRHIKSSLLELQLFWCTAGHESEEYILKSLDYVTKGLEEQLDCILLAISRIDPDRVCRNIYGLIHPVPGETNSVDATDQADTDDVEEQMMDLELDDTVSQS
ncbi:hypothetical protein IL306_009014 [Fusarium sp. DS 682]|nr:hypothetical protein IL306_009014 [Fusarium sp. DS 682]